MVVREDEWSPLMREGESGGPGCIALQRKREERKKTKGYLRFWTVPECWQRTSRCTTPGETAAALRSRCTLKKVFFWKVKTDVGALLGRRIDNNGPTLGGRFFCRLLLNLVFVERHSHRRHCNLGEGGKRKDIFNKMFPHFFFNFFFK